jgi:hypothetical protein
MLRGHSPCGVRVTISVVRLEVAEMEGKAAELLGPFMAQSRCKPSIASSRQVSKALRTNVVLDGG